MVNDFSLDDSPSRRRCREGSLDFRYSQHHPCRRNRHTMRVCVGKRTVVACLGIQPLDVSVEGERLQVD